MKVGFTSFKRESESHWLIEHNWFVFLDSELRSRGKSAWRRVSNDGSIKIGVYIKQHTN